VSVADVKILTTGRLDGLMIQPLVVDGAVTHLHLTFDTLPGLRLIIEADAARELRDALCVVLDG
jgi:hypothetical protein